MNNYIIAMKVSLGKCHQHRVLENCLWIATMSLPLVLGQRPRASAAKQSPSHPQVEIAHLHLRRRCRCRPCGPRNDKGFVS